MTTLDGIGARWSVKTGYSANRSSDRSRLVSFVNPLGFRFIRLQVMDSTNSWRRLLGSGQLEARRS